MENDQRMTIWFLCKESVSPEDIHLRDGAEFGKSLTSHVVFGDGATMFGKKAETYTPRWNPVGRQLSSVTSEFWLCSMENPSTLPVRLFMAWVFPISRY
jgi:hypothetical protein